MGKPTHVRRPSHKTFFLRRRPVPYVWIVEVSRCLKYNICPYPHVLLNAFVILLFSAVCSISCFNGGECTDANLSNCSCPDGFTGSLCQTREYCPTLSLVLSKTVDLHPSKALFSMDTDNLQLHCFFSVRGIVLLFVLLSSRPIM